MKRIPLTVHPVRRRSPDLAETIDRRSQWLAKHLQLQETFGQTMCEVRRPAYSVAAVAWVVLLSLAALPASAQQQPNLAAPAALQGNAQGNQANFVGDQQNGLFPGPAGGAANADFDSLIDLIYSTVDSDSWAENGTGAGEISPFPTGVYADAAGTLRFTRADAATVVLARLQKGPPENVANDVRETSPLRYVSLPRLEAAIAERQAKHQPLPPEMLTLAGLQRVEYIFVLPESGDLVLAGPAGDWSFGADGVIVAVDSGRPVVRLDDLLTLWRRDQVQQGKAFGCSIVPRPQALAAMQAFVKNSSTEPLERGKWLSGLRDTLGTQDVEFFGVEADRRVAQVLLVADYHMKLIGMGLADGVNGVESYLNTVQLLPDGTAPPMSVLRWWFSMRNAPVETTSKRDAYRFHGPRVEVLSENELLAAQGRRVHTGQSEEMNRRFADSFTAAFEEISLQYPLYGELRHVFDLALVLELLRREGLVERVGWQPTLFIDSRMLRLPQINVPKEVETVINHRVIRKKHIVAGISGGVWIDAGRSLKVTTTATELPRASAKPRAPVHREADETVWWWD